MKLKDLGNWFRAKKILVFADFIDPFCYIGFHNVRLVAEAHQIDLKWRGLELNPDTPPEGLKLETSYNSDLRPGMWASVRDLAEKSGLNFPEPQHVWNTQRAHSLVEIAREFNVKNPLIERLYQAYFMNGEDISQSDVLLKVAASFQLPLEKVKAALTDPQKSKRVEAHHEEAKRRVFPGMPGFVYKGKSYFGALSQAAWEKILM